jgi:DNA-directed RNA polymerase specialized sigma24 family protein
MQSLVKSYPMAAPALSSQSQNARRVADPALREGLLKYARGRLPPGEVEDLVQNTLTDALVATNPPSDQTDFRRWVHGIARHKIADSYRRRGRLPILGLDVDHSAAQPSPTVTIAELGQWIERELPKTEGAQATLHWLLREGDGESLDEIARDADLPAPRVRQRVSRLRRHFHARWLALGAAGLVLVLGAGALFQRAWQPALVPPSIAREPLSPLERARILRQGALLRCAAGAYRECIAALDQARALDPNGESASAIRKARDAAANTKEQRAMPNVPAGNAPPSLPEPQSAPKQKLPGKVQQMKRLPSKAVPKPVAPTNAAPQNVLPETQAVPPAAGATGADFSSKQPKSKKL